MAAKYHRIIYDLSIIQIEDSLVLVEICILNILSCNINCSNAYVTPNQLDVQFVF